VFTAEDRARIRSSLLDYAAADEAISAAALVGSTATGHEDAWSDIDLALRLTAQASVDDVAHRWAKYLRESHDARHHVDINAGGTLYRVFLLSHSLQVDISFWPDEDFRATQPGFALVFGAANPPTTNPEPDVDHLIGVAWLYALHARSAIARGRLWQAVMMLDATRDMVISLACVRHVENAHHGRGVDRLPGVFLQSLERARARSVELNELRRSLAGTLSLLHHEATRLRPHVARQLAEPLSVLASP
jgi:predicted nucleotidyltransferase